MDFTRNLKRFERVLVSPRIYIYKYTLYATQHRLKFVVSFKIKDTPDWKNLHMLSRVRKNRYCLKTTQKALKPTMQQNQNLFIHQKFHPDLVE